MDANLQEQAPWLMTDSAEGESCFSGGIIRTVDLLVLYVVPLPTTSSVCKQSTGDYINGSPPHNFSWL